MLTTAQPMREAVLSSLALIGSHVPGLEDMSIEREHKVVQDDQVHEGKTGRFSVGNMEIGV